MLSLLLTVAGSAGVIYFIEKATNDKLDKGTNKKMQFVSTNEEKEVNELDLIKQRYREVYSDFRAVKDYFKRGSSSKFSSIGELFDELDRDYLVGGKIPSDKEEREPLLKYLELLLKQKIVWKRVKDVTTLYSYDELDSNILNLITELIQNQYNEFIELEKISKEERKETAVNLLNDLNTEKDLYSLVENKSIVELKSQENSLLETTNNLGRLLKEIE